VGANCIDCEGDRTGCVAGGGTGCEGDVAIEVVVDVADTGEFSCC